MIRMRGFFKKTLVSVMAVSLVAGLTACGGGTAEEVKSEGFTPKLATDTVCSIRVAGSYSNFESLESEFERFYQYYPNVSCDYVYMDDYENTIVSALMSDEAPDIYVTQSWMLDDDRMSSVLENAEVLSDPALGIDLECIREGARWTLDNGDVVMVPIFTRSYGMLVNMDIFEQNGLTVPENYAELLETCEKLRAAGYETPIMGANATTTAGIYYAFSFPMFCAEMIRFPELLEGYNALNSDCGELMRPALERLQEFVDKGYLDPARCSEEITDDYNAVIMRFFEGDVPMMLGNGDMVSGTAKRESKSEAFSASPFKYQFYVVPIGDEGGYFMDAVNLFFSVNKNSANLDMTNEFMRFLVSEKELGNMAALKRLITPTSDFSLDEVYSSLEGFPAERTFSYRDTGLNDAANKEFRNAAYNVANGTMTVDEAVEAYGSLGK